MLGPDIVCDGYRRGSAIRVQTHTHRDHIRGFNRSKGRKIVCSEATRDLLIVEFDADLPYRSNLKTLSPDEEISTEKSTLRLVPNGHMLGSVAAVVQMHDGSLLGYSGDFSWPQDNVVTVDALVVDATYGSPQSIRHYTQGDAEEAFLRLVSESLGMGPVYVTAFRGTVERALDLVSGCIDCEIICGDALIRDLDVYKRHGYTINGHRLWRSGTSDADQVIASGRYLRFYSTGEARPIGREGVSVVKLSAFGMRGQDPVQRLSDRAYMVGMSNHADFHGTLDFVRSTGAKYVVTDNTRGGQAVELAIELRQRLGVEAWPSSNRLEIGYGEEAIWDPALG